VSPAADAILRRCLDPDPERRYASARDLHEDLQRQREDRPLKHTPEPSLRERLWKFQRRNPALVRWAAIVCAALALVAAAGFGVRAVFLARDREELSRLAEAQASRDGFRTQLEVVKTLLRAKPEDAGDDVDGLKAADLLLGRYGVLTDPDWRNRPLVARLSEDERKDLATDVGELLWLMAEAQARRGAVAAGGTDPARERLPQALLLNQAAEDCFPSDRLPQLAVWLQRADLYRRLGEADRAKEWYDKSAGGKPQTAFECYLLGRHQLEEGRSDRAAELLERATRLDPKLYWAWFLLGNVHDARGADEQAAACYNVCVTLDSRSYFALYNRGHAYFRMHSHDRALEDFDAAIRLDPRPEAYLNRGLLRQHRNEPKKAIEDFDTALEKGAPAAWVCYYRSGARAQDHDPEGARRDRDECKGSRPTDPPSWVARALARRDDRDFDGALADLDEALALNRNFRPALRTKAEVLAERLGRNADAVGLLDRVLELSPGHLPALAGRGVLHARLGHREAALADARRALDLGARGLERYQVGCIFALLAENDDERNTAVKLLAEAVGQGFGAPYLATDPDLAGVRATEKFKSLQEIAGLLPPVR
jgi:tetratricopeptide (TPR) repeat protein